MVFWKLCNSGHRDDRETLLSMEFPQVAQHNLKFHDPFRSHVPFLYKVSLSSHSCPVPISILHIEIKKLRTHTGSFILFQFLNMNPSRTKCQFMSRLTTVNGLTVVFAH